MEDDYPGGVLPENGDWTGVLGVGGGALRLRMRAPDGFNGSVALFSLDQGGVAIPGVARTAADGQITIRFAAVSSVFTARLNGARLEGVWRQNGETPLTFVQGEAGLTPSASAPLTQTDLEALRQKAGAPALIAGAQRNGKAPLAFVDGVRAANAAAPVSSVDRWHIGSITKSMTATVAARLVEAGVLRWTDTIESVLGDQIGAIGGAVRQANLLHLLSHHSGLQGNIGMPQFLAFRSRSDALAAQRIAYAKLALAQTPVGSPGQTFLYSNSGYILAGAMLEARTGKPWEDLIRAELFEPLGMVGAGLGAPGQPGALDEPVGHAAALFGAARRPYPAGGEITDNPAVLGPAGRVHARMADMLTYLGAHRDRPQFLKPESWARLHTPPFTGRYALGWEVRQSGLWHNGSNTLWYAEASVGPYVVSFAAANDGVLNKSAPAVGEALARVTAALA
jgi:CubicO group peptidase (beta-lactamase class C family)